MSRYEVNRKTAVESARARNLEVITADDRTLLLDLDSIEAVEHYNEMLPVLQESLRIREIASWPSENGNTHVKLSLPSPLSIRSRLILQLVLGSDPMKEFLSLVRVWRKESDPIILFKPKPHPKRKSVTRIDENLYEDDVPI